MVRPVIVHSMASTVRFGVPSFVRWYLAVFAVAWVALAAWMIYLSLTNGTWFMVPFLLAVATIAPLLARRVSRVGVELTEVAAIMTPRFGSPRVFAKRTIARFEPGERSAFEAGTSWPLAVRLHDDTVTTLRWAGGWIPGKRGKAQLDSIIAAANAWLADASPAAGGQ